MPATVSPKRKIKADLLHLRSLPAAEPATSTGRVAWIWPEVEASLSTGKKLREVWEAACADGLEISYPQFRVYVSRIRRRRVRQVQPSEPHAAVGPTTAPIPAPSVPTDPFRNLREQRQKKQSAGFEYDPFSIQKPLID
jgi:hypothetical protein